MKDIIINIVGWLIMIVVIAITLLPLFILWFVLPVLVVAGLIKFIF